jgi:hypothetical protein
MRTLPLVAVALLLAVPAKADKFWLSDPAAKDAAPGSTPNVIDGVLLAEDATSYHIRIVGGEIVLPKKAVFKVEKDDLSLDAIVKAEKDSADALAAANRERELQQQIASKEREIKLAEAASRRAAARPVEASAPAVVPATAPAQYDPVLDIAPPTNLPELQRAARMAFEQTRDRAYLKELRQLRRLR